MTAFADGHVHLAMQRATLAPQWRRWAVIVMMSAAVAAIVASFFYPWWHITLYAPQYPHGLRMSISLTGVTGDVSEIDELNHYIGMAKLETVATREREYAAYGVAGVGVAVLAMTMLLGRKLGWFIIAPALAFPSAFVADSYYWLHRCGHTLDPHAPIRLAAFTPQLFGNGEIGQFLTFALPSPGFWIACAGAALVIAATVVRQRGVCARCSRRGDCGVVCRQLLVRKERA